MAPERVERGQAVRNLKRERRGVVRLVAAQAAFACVAAVVCLAPFPLGSTAASFVAAWSLLLGLAAICSVPARLSGKSIAFLLAAFVCVGAYLVVVHEQISVRPWFSSGLVHPIWARAGAVLGEDFPPIVSVVRDVPLIAIGAELAFVLMLLVSFAIASDRRDGLRLLRVVAFAGAAYALLGIVTFAVDPGKILSGRIRQIISPISRERLPIGTQRRSFSARHRCYGSSSGARNCATCGSGAC
ncbi:hypothetical protein ACQ86E_21305 [Bradyrhizobium betae]|uniref:hypothetical protein n=1 Tax=Bradyrhizobium betae TaxID=244734 RepID=UPI003D666206